MKKMKEQQSQKGKTKERKDKNTEESEGMVPLPYVKGVTEPVQGILKHCEIATSVRPHQNIERVVVHSKDKVEDNTNTDCVYQIDRESNRHAR